MKLLNLINKFLVPTEHVVSVHDLDFKSLTGFSIVIDKSINGFELTHFSASDFINLPIRNSFVLKDRINFFSNNFVRYTFSQIFDFNVLNCVYVVDLPNYFYTMEFSGLKKILSILSGSIKQDLME